MDELEISGKRYISTRRAAREHGYHSDYMGQLIRGKKVVGQKVGRAWYIEEESLNAYLGKTLVASPAPKVAPAPAPVEQLITQEPAPVVASAPEQAPAVSPEMQPAAAVVVPEPVAPQPAQVIQNEEAQPVMRIEPEPERAYVQPVQEIHHAPIERNETRIPIHTQTPVPQEVGGLRYAPDDAPSIPVVMRTPHASVPTQYHVPDAPQAVRTAGRFPYVSLCIVGIVAVLVTAFASNFVSATIVSQQGKAATVQYAIHW